MEYPDPFVSAFVTGIVKSQRRAALADADLQALLAEMDDEELMDAMREDDSLVYSLPDSRYTRELCLEMVALNGSNLQFVPAAVRYAPGFEHDAALAEMWAFGYVSAANKTEALLLEVIDEVHLDVSMFGETWAVPDALLTPAVISALKAKFSAASVEHVLAFRRPP